MDHRIQNLLSRIEAEHGVEILYACESGSRAWGFASPDLYALRATLAARHVLDNGSPPPVAFADLIDLAPAETVTAIRELLVWKAEATEKASPGRMPVLDRYLQSTLPALSEAIEVLPDDPPPVEPFEEVLRRWTLWPSPLGGPRMRKADFTLTRVRQPDLLLFECLSGSRAFGTHHERSDHDLRGVFVAPPTFLCGLGSIDQVGDEKGDEVCYELGRFIALLTANNPNLIELLYTPESCLRFKHPAFDLVRPDAFLSKLCRQSFGNYAMVSRTSCTRCASSTKPSRSPAKAASPCPDPMPNG